MNMRNLKVGVFVLTSLFLGLGYIGNQVAYSSGLDALREYVAGAQNPGVIALSFVLFVLAVGLSFVPDRELSN